MSQENPAPAAPDAPAGIVAPAPVVPGGRLSAAEIAAHLDALEKEPDAPAAEETPADDADEGEGDGESTPDEEPADAEDEPSDSDLDKRIGAVQKQEKRSRDQAELKRLELLREVDERKAAIEAEWRPKVEQAERLRGLIDRAKTDPTALFDEIGKDWDRETKLYAAHALFAEAKAEEGDPKYREQVAKTRREREERARVSDQAKEIAELKAEMARERAERKVEAVAAKAVGAVTDKHPVLKSLKPEYVEARLRKATAYIHEQTGQAPDPAFVVAELELIERRDLLERIGPERFAALGLATKRAAIDQKQKTKPAEKKETAPTMTQPTPKYSPPNRRRSAEEILAEIDAQEQKP